MAKPSSISQKSSRYIQGGYVDRVGDNLGWWEPTSFERSTTDINLIIEARYSRRPDLLAYKLYGSASLMWFILQYNGISDPIEEFVEGVSITFPTRQRLLGEMLYTIPRPKA
jgi:hypothetical protein